MVERWREALKRLQEVLGEPEGTDAAVTMYNAAIRISRLQDALDGKWVPPNPVVKLDQCEKHLGYATTLYVSTTAHEMKTVCPNCVEEAKTPVDTVRVESI